MTSSSERPSADSDDLARLARELLADLDRLVDGSTAAIRRENQLRDQSTVISEGELRESIRANYAAVLNRLGDSGHPVVLGQARRNGQERARAGVPLTILMVAYRIGTRHLWQSLVERARASGVGDSPLVMAASDLWDVQDELISAMAASYRDEQQSMILAQGEERSALVQALLEGQIIEASTLWEIADLLGVGQDGPYVVVAAQLSEVSRLSLPAVEAALRGFGIASAWRLRPDTQIGIVYLGGRTHLQQLLDILRRMATTRIGVSPTYLQLSETAANLRLARIAMTGSIPDKAAVTVFDSDALAVTAAAAPDITIRVADGILRGLSGLPQIERAVLLDTFEAWLDSDGSTAAAAAKLYCHHNTVRHRLRRLEQHTGRSLSSPRQLSELCLALEIDRRVRRV
ncbi:MAG TPA: helix-turn-helix domain-containing protein [Pseudonocardia sp.]|nr:helix-turn-helix domain-containing protein [Pseudonocardia sp.]